MKFRKKPVTIEAWPYRANARKHPPCVCDCVDGERPRVERRHIHTLEGAHALRDGDWIIRGVKGEFYPCKPDIFEMTYEKIEGEQP